MIKVILGAIVVTFISWGGYQVTSDRLNRVAEVNGDTISIDEYKLTYQQMLQQAQQSFGNNLSDELLKTLNLPKRALDQLIEGRLLLQTASDLKLQVSNEELMRSIESIDAFQTAGAFDPQRYYNVLSYMRMTPEQFEKNHRDSLLIGKLRQLIVAGVKVSEQEMTAWYNWNNAAVNVLYVLFGPEEYTDIQPSDEEIVQYYEQNKESYQTEPQIKVAYLEFHPDEYKERVTLSDAQLLDYYESNLENYQKPKTVEARHILIKVDEDADAQEVARAKGRIEEVLQQAREGKDFAELAKQYSEDPSKDKGGYLGEFGREMMVEPFAETAFAMEVGEISEPVKTQFGWHLIKLEKIHPASTQTFEQAKDEISNRLIQEESRDIAYEMAETASDASFAYDTLEDVAASLGLELKTTDFFTRGGELPGMQNPNKFATFAFSLPESEISEIQDLGKSFVIIQVVERVPAVIADLKDVRDKVESNYIADKQKELARRDAAALLAELKKDSSLPTVSQRYNRTPKESGYFKRNDAIPDIGREPAVNNAAFNLSAENPLPDDVIDTRKGFVVIQYEGRRQPAAENLREEKEAIKERLLRQKQFRTFDAWLQQIKNNSTIDIAEGFWTS